MSKLIRYGSFFTIRVPQGTVVCLASREREALLAVQDSFAGEASFVACGDEEVIAAAEAHLARLRAKNAGAKQTPEELDDAMGRPVAGLLGEPIADVESWLAKARVGIVRSRVVSGSGYVNVLEPVATS